MQLDYQAPPGCPSKNEFLSALAARTRAPSHAAYNASSVLAVNIDASNQGFRGVARITAGGGQGMERTLEDRHCGVLVEALAFVVALELNPPNIGQTDARAKSPAVTATLQQTTGTAASPERNRTGQRDYELFVAALAGLQTAQTPNALGSAGVHLALQRRSQPQSVGVSLEYGQTGVLKRSGGDVRFRWFASRWFGCPLGLRYDLLATSLCVITEVGQLWAEPQHTLDGATRRQWWIAPGVGAFTSLQSDGFALQLFAGAVRPIVRDEFYFAGVGPSDPPEIVNHPSAVGLAAELRVGTSF